MEIQLQAVGTDMIKWMTECRNIKVKELIVKEILMIITPQIKIMKKLKKLKDQQQE